MATNEERLLPIAQQTLVEISTALAEEVTDETMATAAGILVYALGAVEAAAELRAQRRVICASIMQLCALAQGDRELCAILQPAADAAIKLLQGTP